MSCEFHSRAETVLEIRRGGNYFEPEQRYNSLILCDMATRSRKFINNAGWQRCESGTSLQLKRLLRVAPYVHTCG